MTTTEASSAISFNWSFQRLMWSRFCFNYEPKDPQFRPWKNPQTRINSQSFIGRKVIHCSTLSSAMLRNMFVRIFGLRWLKNGSSQKKMGNENCRRQWRKLNQQRTFWGSANIFVMLKTSRSEFSIQSQFKLCRRSEKQGTGLINARLSHWHNMVQFAVVEKNVLASQLDKLLNCRNGFITTRNCALSSSA